MQKTRPTKDQEKQLATLDAISDADIDLSDIPDLANKPGWARASTHGTVTPAPNRQFAQDATELPMTAEANMATFDWSDCPLVEIIPGKVSGAPLLRNTRLPGEAIIGNYDAFIDEGLSPEAAMTETIDCYPEAGRDAIKTILNYRAELELEAQL